MALLVAEEAHLRVQPVEEGGLDHGDFVDDKHLQGTPPLRGGPEVAFAEVVYLDRHPAACERVQSLPVAEQRGDAGGSGHRDMPPFFAQRLHDSLQQEGLACAAHACEEDVVPLQAKVQHLLLLGVQLFGSVIALLSYRVIRRRFLLSGKCLLGTLLLLVNSHWRA